MTRWCFGKPAHACGAPPHSLHMIAGDCVSPSRFSHVSMLHASLGSIQRGLLPVRSMDPWEKRSRIVFRVKTKFNKKQRKPVPALRRPSPHPARSPRPKVVHRCSSRPIPGFHVAAQGYVAGEGPSRPHRKRSPRTTSDPKRRRCSPNASICSSQKSRYANNERPQEMWN